MLTQSTVELTPVDTIVQRWEDAGNQLAQSISAFLDSCLALDTCSRADFTDTSELISRIDNKLGPLRTGFESQLIRSYATLAHTRNKLVARLCCFPDEIMASIFGYFIRDFDHDSFYKSPSVSAMEQQARVYYRRLGVIGRVCSVWRDIIASTGSLWSLIPVMYNAPESSQRLPVPFELLETLLSTRTQGGNLHIAMCLPPAGVPHGPIPDFSSYASRTCSVNIEAPESDDIDLVSKHLLKRGGLRSLTEFSVYYTGRNATENAVEFPSFYKLILELSDWLRILRIGGLDLSYNRLRFSHLAELRVQDIQLRSSRGAQVLLDTIASSPRLRVLQIISVSTLYSPGDAGHSTGRLSIKNPIALPDLEILHLEDLGLGLANVLLHSIDPGSRCSIRLHATPKLFQSSYRQVESYRNVFQHVNIRALFLVKNGWLIDAQPSNIFHLLLSMNCLEELHLHSWCKWSALVPESTNGDFEPPAFQKLYITNGYFKVASEIEEVVMNCPVQYLTLGGSIGQQEIREIGEVVAWLENTVPHLSLIPAHQFVPGLTTSLWYL